MALKTQYLSSFKYFSSQLSQVVLKGSNNIFTPFMSSWMITHGGCNTEILLPLPHILILTFM